MLLGSDFGCHSAHAVLQQAVILLQKQGSGGILMKHEHP
jgi:hypothetical protein